MLCEYECEGCRQEMLLDSLTVRDAKCVVCGERGKMYLTLAEQFKQTFFNLSSKDQYRLKQIHMDRKHEGIARNCVVCRDLLRYEGVNIPYYWRGEWTDSTLKPKSKLIKPLKRGFFQFIKDQVVGLENCILNKASRNS